MMRFVLFVPATGTAAKQITGKWFLGVEDDDTAMQVRYHMGPGLLALRCLPPGRMLPFLRCLHWWGWTLQATFPRIPQLASRWDWPMEGTVRKLESRWKGATWVFPSHSAWGGSFSCSFVSFLGPVSPWTRLLCGAPSVRWPWPLGSFMTSPPPCVSPPQVGEPLATVANLCNTSLCSFDFSALPSSL